MPGGDGLENAVMAFVAAELSVKEETLRVSTRLRQDLGVDGDDADDFIEAFAERFRVDLTDFDFDRHFTEEGGANPLLYLWWRWRSPEKVRRIPVTLEDLVEAARRGRWRTPTHAPA